MDLDALTVTRAVVHGGPATLEALRARVGGTDASTVAWALQDALDHGWITSSAGQICDADGICSMSVPTVVTATDSGRAAARA